ncbi:MAG: SMC-Scp complex subunit ScpB [Spirochaetaceae bacterium]
MELTREKALIEAILYLESEPVEERRLATVSGLSREIVRRVLAALEQDYEDEGRGLMISRLEDGVGLAPKRSLWEHLKDHYGKRREARLSKAALETLSIIAYAQPVTRAEIENLRGVSADNMIRLLLTRDLIKETGRKDAPGRPAQYGTTREFLKQFGLESISDLPKLDEVEEDRFKLDG